LHRNHKKGKIILKKLASLATGLVFLSLAGSACASQIWVGIEDDSSKIKQYDLDGNYTGFSDLGTATNPISMTQVGSEVWVGIEDYDSKINRYDLSGNYSGFIDLGAGYNNPLSMTQVGSEVWVGIEDYDSKINRYDLDGNYTGFIDIGTATNPLSMTQVGSEVWVGIEDYNSKINRYDLDGNFTGFIDLGNGYNNPLAMTYVTQVAEPTTILIFGSSLVGLLSARIRRKKLQKAGVIKPQPCSNSSTR